MATLIEFLRARLDEAEADENNTYRATALVECPKCFSTSASQSSGDDFVRFEPCGHTVSNTDFMAKFSEPAPNKFALADIAAKRRIIALYEDTELRASTFPTREDRQAARIERAVLADVIKALALPYADHPDYQADWRP